MALPQKKNDTRRQVRCVQAQIAAVLATMVGSALVLVSLQGSIDRLLDRFPNKDYSYLDILSRISGLIFLATAVFYFTDTWRQCRESPEQRSLRILLAANLLALAVAAVKLGMIFQAPSGTGRAEAEEEDLAVELL